MWVTNDNIKHKIGAVYSENMMQYQKHLHPSGGQIYVSYYLNNFLDNNLPREPTGWGPHLHLYYPSNTHWNYRDLPEHPSNCSCEEK